MTMKKKILSTLLAGAAIATMGTMSAQAGSLSTVAGPVKILYDGFDAAQTKYSTATNGILCNTVASCDAASIAGDIFGPGTADAPGASIANDTYGVALVSSIKQNVAFGSTFFNDGDNGESLVAYFYGFNDAKVDVVSPTQTNVFSIGGHVDLYRVASGFLGGLDMTNQATIMAGLGALPSAYLTADFIPGCDGGVSTLCGTFNLATLFGGSNGKAIATGGDAFYQYPNNFSFEQSIEPCGISVACPAPSSFNIVVKSSSATTMAVPEPGALGLLGLGLVGMGLVARRRKVA